MCKSTNKYTIKQFKAQFPDDEACLNHLFHLRYGKMKECPKCGCGRPYVRVKNRRCHQCPKCYNQIYATANSIFHRSTTPLVSWYFVIFLFTTSKNGVSACEVQRHLGCTYKTAWKMLHKIRTLMGQDSIEFFTGTVESDETFVGGKNKNRHYDKKVEQSQGRSFKDKTPVLGLVERSEYCYITRPSKVDPTKDVTEKVVTKLSKARGFVVPNTSSQTLKPLIYQYVEPGSSLMTDEWQAYNGLCKFYDHQIVDHSKGQYVNGHAGCNAAENLWSSVKRTIKGSYISVSRKYLQLYVNECVYRYNHRDKGQMFIHLLNALAS